VNGPPIWGGAPNELTGRSVLLGVMTTLIFPPPVNPPSSLPPPPPPPPQLAKKRANTLRHKALLIRVIIERTRGTPLGMLYKLLM
jgi:hypothetical protein